MERTRQLLMIGRKWRVTGGNTIPGYWKPLTSKASNRAAVHGVKLPIPDILDKEQVEKDIQKAKEDKEAKRKQIEKTIESQFNNSPKSESSSAH